MVDLAQAAGFELVIACDGQEAFANLENDKDLSTARLVPVESKGYLESVHDKALIRCLGDYVLRLDDDERCSPAMVEWLLDGAYRQDDHWKFARAHLWKDREHFLLNAPLWQDHQTRLSVRQKAGGRTNIHCGSPYGGGRLAPVVIEHHKFLVKSVEERRAIAKRYDSLHPGTGTGGFLPFNLPEEAYLAFEIGDFRHGWLV